MLNIDVFEFLMQVHHINIIDGRLDGVHFKLYYWSFSITNMASLAVYIIRHTDV